MRSEVWGVTLAASCTGGVFTVQASGLLTFTAVRGVRVWLAENAPDKAGAVLLDYQRCAIAITDDELQSLAQPGRPLVPSIPLAWLLANEATAALWQRQVLRLALCGHRRFATCLPEAAHAWATEQARLELAAARLRTVARP